MAPDIVAIATEILRDDLRSMGHSEITSPAASCYVRAAYKLFAALPATVNEMQDLSLPMISERLLWLSLGKIVLLAHCCDRLELNKADR
jgi:hypothetical protein